MKHRVVGPHTVSGTPPGELVDLSDLTQAQVAALVEAGHVREERQKDKVETSDQDKKETS